MLENSIEMNWNKHIRTLIFTVLPVFIASCTPESYDSSVQDYGQLKVSVTGAEQLTHVLLIPEVDTIAFDGPEVQVDSIPGGNHRIILYSKSDGFFYDGSVASCVTTEADIYVESTMFNIRPSVVNEIHLQPRKFNRVVHLELQNAETVTSATAIMGNVASAVDMEFNRLMNPQNIIMPLTCLEADDSYEKQEKVLGFIGDDFQIRLEVSGEDENALQISVDLSEIGYNPYEACDLNIVIDMSVNPLVAEVTLGERTCSVDIRESYRVGDYYPNPNVDITDPISVSKIEGIVLEVGPDGFHGKILSLQEGSSLAWNTTGAADYTDDEDDGMANFTTVKAKDPSFASYPAFAWCASLGEGWYIPAVNEVLLIRTVWQANKTLLDNKFTEIGATPLSATKYVSSKGNNQASYYYSSTEYADSPNKILSVSFNGTSAAGSGLKKSSGTQENLLYRAVKLF